MEIVMEEKNEKIDEKILYDYTRDAHFENRMSKLLLLAMTLVLALMVVGTVIICISNQRSMEKLAEHNAEMIVDFLSQYDFETTVDVTTDNNMFSAGNVTVLR